MPAASRRGRKPEEVNYVDIASVSTGKIDEVRLLPFNEAPGRARRIIRHGDIIWSTVRTEPQVVQPDPEPVAGHDRPTGFAIISGTKAPYHVFVSRLDY